MAGFLAIECSVPCGTIDCLTEDQLDLLKSFLSYQFNHPKGCYTVKNKRGSYLLEM